MIKDSKVRGVTVSTLCLSVQTTGTGCAGGQCWSPDVCVYISLLLVPWLTIVIPQLARYSSLPGVLIKYLSDFEVQIGFLSDLDYLFCLGVGTLEFRLSIWKTVLSWWTKAWCVWTIRPFMICHFVSTFCVVQEVNSVKDIVSGHWCSSISIVSINNTTHVCIRGEKVIHFKTLVICSKQLWTLVMI